jgi:hypothetical protein
MITILGSRQDKLASLYKTFDFEAIERDLEKVRRSTDYLNYASSGGRLNYSLDYYYAVKLS